MSEHRRDSDAKRSDTAHRKWMQGIADGLLQIERYRDDIQEAKPTLTAFRVKCDPDDEMGVLVIAEGYIGSVWWVAFHRADTISEAIKGLGNRLRNGSLAWREDARANARRGGTGGS